MLLTVTGPARQGHRQPVGNWASLPILLTGPGTLRWPAVGGSSRSPGSAVRV
jgi:hypothetical protein